MAAYPPGVPPVPPPGYDPRSQRRFLRDQERAQRAAMRAQAAQLRYQMRSHRRGSVLGPLLLIGIGVVFLLLQTGRIQQNSFWSWYGHWWPLLLVCAGAVVLAEWAFDQYALRDPDRTPYRRSLGGGVVFLLIFLAIAGVAAESARLHIEPNRWFYGWNMTPDSLDEFFGDKHESDETADVAFPAGSTLSVVNPRGDVTINGTSDDGHVHIAVHKQVWERSDSAAETRAQQLTPTTSTNGSAITVTLPALDGARSDLVISVPTAAGTTVTANRGDIHIASIQANVMATANHGDVELSAITGSATAHINSGGSSISAHSIGNGISIQGHADDVTLSDITGPVSISGDFFGTTHLERVSGAVHFHTSRTDLQLARLDGSVEISPDMDLSADQALGPVVVTTRDRNITLDRIAGDISVVNRNGTINVTAAPKLGDITLEDRNGTIKAMLPDRTGFAVQANTTNGNIDTDLQLTSNTSGDSGRDERKSLSGTVGSGGPTVRITTSNGDISIHKDEIAPIPPEPPVPPKITLTPPPAVPKASAAPKPAAPRAPAAPLQH